MNINKTGMMIATAAACLIATVSFAESTTTTTTITTNAPNNNSNPPYPASTMIHCVGINSCKGQTSCRTAYNACKGLNSCKGQGWMVTTEFKCQQDGGTIAK